MWLWQNNPCCPLLAPRPGRLLLQGRVRDRKEKHRSVGQCGRQKWGQRQGQRKGKKALRQASCPSLRPWWKGETSRREIRPTKKRTAAAQPGGPAPHTPRLGALVPSSGP
nr:uncharacterized protein ADAMTSL4-AS1-like [Aotus nancymaae]